MKLSTLDFKILTFFMQCQSLNIDVSDLKQLVSAETYSGLIAAVAKLEQRMSDAVLIDEKALDVQFEDFIKTEAKLLNDALNDQSTQTELTSNNIAHELSQHPMMPNIAQVPLDELMQFVKIIESMIKR